VIQDRIPLLLPKALLNGDFVQYRKYPFKLMVLRSNDFISVRIDKVIVKPAWAKFYMEQTISGKTVESYGTLDGTITTDIDITELEQTDLVIWNESVDTEALAIFHIRAWQFGES
jgi:hypothetical protein